MPITDALAEMVFPPAGDSGGAQSAASLTPTASPFKYVATSRQALHITGGVINTVSYARGSLLLALAVATGGQLIEMNTGDAVTITYATAPTLTIIPR
ncbi:hypothetical protein BM43_3058 [Burkholderia gladioli]|uniref:Uncharacterized protein n=1 Tax=Burkholderia gladioli TaxID=28095 RepID=A0AAW3EPQ0_BURGA|nr:hypothetical protein [Burkholderia gladioli]AJX00417.1 hypothetical protein BM43_3058 [Burkholderia gladioli]ASD79030.1 hypothetical protein CEJ98_08405 [Burkholderia gladioli pv. gladioli]AWY55729.1 hypothetical protein A8H28_32750 [Burkholderia gladioli pv. gladioli]KGC09603.1 hypothetical protein DM48_5786 [Burkholderia gladioli]KGC09677.1 hypothetical protein DM48_5838 [Burkholderia gladioli]